MQEQRMLHECLEEVFRERGGAAAGVSRASVADDAYDQELFHDGLPMMESLREELHDALSRRIAELTAGTVDQEPREGTVKWHFKYRNSTLSEHSTMTVWQFCYGIMWQKLYANTVGKGVDLMCRWLSSGGALPPKNYAPR